MPVEQILLPRRVGILGRLISLFKLLLGSIIYFFKSNIAGLYTVWQDSAKTPVGAISAIFSVLLALLDALILYKSKNRNLGKTVDFFFSVLQAVLIVLVVSTFFALPVVQALLLTLITINMARSLTGLFYSLYKYKLYSRGTDRYPRLQKAYKQAIAEQATRVGISLMLLVPFLVFTLFFTSLPSVVLLAVGITASVFLLILTLHKVYRFFFSTRAIGINTNNSVSTDSASQVRSSRGLTERPIGFEYQYARDRVLNLTGSLDEDIRFLRKEIAAKIVSLSQQIQGSSKVGQSFFGNEEPKRLAKRDLLQRFLVFLLEFQTLVVQDDHPENQRIACLDKIELYHVLKVDSMALCRELGLEACLSMSDYYQTFQQFKGKYEKNHRYYQSFLKKIGDVEDIIKAIEVFFENVAKKIVTDEVQPEEQDNTPTTLLYKPF